MDLQVALLEPLQLLQQQAGAGIHQQATAQLRLRGVHRHIQRREALLLNPAPVGLAQVGEGEVRAVEKAEAVVVVLQIQAAALARWLLVDEAERAGVVALLEPIEQSLGEAQAQALIEVLLQLHAVDGAVGVFHLQHQIFFAHQHMQIDQVAGALTVDAQQPVAGLEAQLLTDRTRLHRGHHRGLGQPRRLTRRAGVEGNGQAGGGFIPHGEGRRQPRALPHHCAA